VLCTLLGACHASPPATQPPDDVSPSGTGGSPGADAPRVFTATNLIYEGMCTLCKDTFRVTGFNNRNEVTGTFSTGNNATFLFSNGSLSTFWADSGYSFQHINDDGIIHGAVWGAPAKFVGLQPTTLEQVMPPYVVNNLGHICGRVESQTVCHIDDQEKKLDVVFDKYAELSDSGLLVGTLGSKAQILNIATGESARFDQDSDAVSVSSAGQVVGNVSDNGIMRPFVYRDGVLTVLSIPADYKLGVATDINSRGEVVGVIAIDGMGGWHSPGNPTTGGVASKTLFDFFYCSAALACMQVGSTAEAFDLWTRIRINDLGNVIFGGDVSLVLYQ
jgi:hypothetical protein